MSKRRTRAVQQTNELYAPSRREQRRLEKMQRQQEHLKLVDAEFVRETPRRKSVKLIPKSRNQETYLAALEDDSQYIVLATGPAGSGKTLLATQYAIKALQEGKVEKIIITRPAVSVDEEHGFLPGTLVEKMAPWTRPIMDIFKQYYRPQEVVKMLEDEVIEICPLAYMRGRTFHNAIILADELQNTTPSQAKMLYSRIGDNSKIVATGDINQHDRGFEVNGLADFIARLEKTGSQHMTVVKFDNRDIQRHPIISEVLNMYGDDVK